MHMAYVALSKHKLLEGCGIGMNGTAFEKNDSAVHAEYCYSLTVQLTVTAVGVYCKCDANMDSTYMSPAFDEFC